MIACAPPEETVGVALRLSGYLDCQARVLGENGFQALAGGPLAASLLSGLITIFVALIGYQLILGRTPGIGDGVTWAVRLGLVLTLVTSWPAFQSLIYRVAAEGPDEVAGILLPAAGLPVEDTNTRLQQAYDTIRLGFGSQPAAASQSAAPSSDLGQAASPQPRASPPPARGLGQPPLPQTASLLVISTVGVSEAFRVAIGFLLAVGPLATMALLFDATMGLFLGWIRALAASALGLVAVTTVTAIELVMVEGELGRLQRYSLGLESGVADPQALTTVVLLFCVVTLLAALAATRMVGTLKAPRLSRPSTSQPNRLARPLSWSSPTTSSPARASASRDEFLDRPPRAAAVADALSYATFRERSATEDRSSAPSRQASIIQGASRTEGAPTILPLGVAGRRSLPRRSGSAARRDRQQ